ncbi:hypothetical protein T265_06253 [Opisthorchis viverrini]|uniref:Uncharacterized protein n=1 Tax=Opisthorchis viverrini TaxID=6198 RepID=A0A074ZGX9_OPIVI|nr:hypothetical protein T265_06253 [Opisthorchis viverrini]KER26536.1 hypothetical protein T265_06253 [Opisthorchis viverrini]
MAAISRDHRKERFCILDLDDSNGYEFNSENRKNFDMWRDNTGKIGFEASYSHTGLINLHVSSICQGLAAGLEYSNGGKHQFTELRGSKPLGTKQSAFWNITFEPLETDNLKYFPFTH